MRKACTVAMFTVMALAPTAYASSFDAATDFSLASNPTPNVVWSYGYSSTLGGPFTLDIIKNTTTFGKNSFSSWQGNDMSCGFCGTEFYPLVVKNTAGTEQVAGTVDLLAGELALHPAANGEFAIVRFTAPTAGLFTIASTFEGRDVGGPASPTGTTTDVHVLLNNAPLFNGEVTGSGAASDQSFSPLLPLPLGAGDTLDFVVGVGIDRNFFDDLTGLSATISPVPEPASLLLLGSGVIGLAWWRRRNNA